MRRDWIDKLEQRQWMTELIYSRKTIHFTWVSRIYIYFTQGSDTVLDHRRHLAPSIQYRYPQIPEIRAYGRTTRRGGHANMWTAGTKSTASLSEMWLSSRGERWELRPGPGGRGWDWQGARALFGVAWHSPQIKGHGPEAFPRLCCTCSACSPQASR
jgi:hypothetical protein